MEIPGFRYHFPDSEIGWIVEQTESLLRGGAFLTLGDHCSAFENELVEQTGIGHAKVMASGTAALQAIFRYLKVGGKEVIIPTNTFGATAFAVIAAGGIPVFAESGPDLCLDVDRVAEAITPATGAVVVVHIGGVIQADIERLAAITRSHGVPLVEDAAHAHGSTLHEHHPGSWGTAAAYSMFSTKLVTAGEGGYVLTDNEELAAYVTQVRDQGKVGGGNLQTVLGYSWRLSEPQAILARSQLRVLPDSITHRRKVAGRYDETLAKHPAFEPLELGQALAPNFYKYTLRLASGAPTAAELTNQLRIRNVTLAGKVYAIPCHLQPVFVDWRTVGDMDASVERCDRHVCLPIYADMTNKEVDRVVEAVNEVLPC